MAWSKAHYAAVGGAVLLFSLLYFGLSTRPPQWAAQERSRTLRGEQTGKESLVAAAKARLSSEERAAVLLLEQAVEAAPNEEERAERLKTLSAWWFARNYRGVAGAVAEEVAETLPSDSAWSVAGATYYQALQAETDNRLRDYYAQRSIQAFEKAASLAPDRVEHRVNIALVYAEQPPADNPMRAVQLLRELERQYPDDAPVYNALGRLAMKTGQWERAVERLEKALQLDPTNPFTPCLLMQAYEKAGKPDKAAALADRCL